MNLRQAITSAAAILAVNKDIENPALESEVLLRNLLKIDRVFLFLNYDKVLEPRQEENFKEWVERRRRGEPVAYIINRREFFNLDFYIDSRVLIPRPETELIVDEAIKFSRIHPVRTIADIGTGSGAIAVSLAVNLPEMRIFATDISISALEVARINIIKHQVEDRITLLEGDLLAPLPSAVDILIANLPYVKTSDWLQMPSGKFEPSLALDGGEDGLDQIFRLGKKLTPCLNPGGCALLEIGLGQSRKIADYFYGLYPATKIEFLTDLAGIERVIKLTFSPTS